MIKLNIVIYNGEQYEVFYAYSSGYYELKKSGSDLDDIILVHSSEVTQLKSSVS
ncbi:hypothetical protein [Metabacillus schmidteae]|uniref:hypothetical protein n=1 Tax=Metabacillus schmidteae TaxID=2730405 RepID=UPI001C37BB34|nr:hypothetical protein [Metabacillus schmidteae]